MNMKKLIYLLFIIIIQNSFGQISNCNLQNDNKIWIAKFEKAKSNIEKIKLIKDKIKADSIYLETKPKIAEHDQPNAKSDNKNSKGEYCGCRIRFMLTQKEKSIEANLNAKPKLSNVIKSLSAEKIEKLEYVNSKDALSLFGPKCKCGVIYIHVKDKKLQKEINSASI